MRSATIAVAKEIEIINADFPGAPYRAAIFDFDGTLSLLRRNWQDVMIPMMVDVLSDLETDESREALHDCVEEFVMRLNGRQTIHQMIQIAEEVWKRGGEPLDPLEYKRRYHDLLWQEVSGRIESVRSKEIPVEEMLVPEADQLLSSLQDLGLDLYLASGTDLVYVRDEVALLELGKFFAQHIYGALDDYKQFSKAMILQQMIRDSNLNGSEIIGFGDGFVEIEEVKKVGGLAIGVASDENGRGGINTWKRNRLVQAGADIIIGDYRQHDSLLQLIGLT